MFTQAAFITNPNLKVSDGVILSRLRAAENGVASLNGFWAETVTADESKKKTKCRTEKGYESCFRTYFCFTLSSP